MGTLSDLFDELDYSENSRYSVAGIYPAEEGGKVLELQPKELLEVARISPSIEQVMIAYFGDMPTKVLYYGEDSTSMLQTLQQLKLPKCPSNVGETVFKLFRQHLEDQFSQNSPISLELSVHSGKEHQFRIVLKKLVHIYAGNQIDKDFYAAL